jgi:hypothetical protein
MNLFEYVNSINSEEKINLFLKHPESNALADKEYVPYIINRQFSYFQDTVLYANELNYGSGIPNKAQYEFYLNAIRPKKRFSRWAKSSEDADLNMIQQTYGYGIQKARQVYKLLEATNQLETLRAHYAAKDGGVSKS